MKGDPRLIEILNSLLSDELTAISQYMVHAEMCANWGYKKLHESFEKRAFTEMRHAEKLIERILFLEGRPIVSNLKEMHIGSEVQNQLNNDYALELSAISAYNNAIKVAGEVNDNATREVLINILNDEDKHVDELEQLRDLINQMGLQLFLSTQL